MRMLRRSRNRPVRILESNMHMHMQRNGKDVDVVRDVSDDVIAKAFHPQSEANDCMGARY